ncbi:MAG TPA: PcfJ domain-containing protein [Candidatus Humimicrobiaceae bacterium]
MKPKTKNQIRVVELSAKLPSITDKQIQYGYNNLFTSYCYLTKNELTCFDCGHTWENEYPVLLIAIDDCICPHCGKRLKMRHSKERHFRTNNYYSVITAFKEFQVIRNFTVAKTCKLNETAVFKMNEVVQNWISPDGEVVNFGLQVNGLSIYYDQWIYNGEMEVRTPHHRHIINPVKIYPTKKLSQTVKRNGFKSSFYNVSPVTLFTSILTNRFTETLLKSNQIPMLKHVLANRSLKIEKYWNSICICIRNGYIIKDASMWIDYIDFLIFFGKDIRNAKYVCPANLAHVHDKYMNKKIEKTIDLNKYEEQFRELKQQYFGIEFSDRLVNIKVLDSVKQFAEEGLKMHHCVYKNEYFLKPDTLILSAQIDSKRIETVEVSLESFNVIQSRGVCNKNSKYHKRIIDMVNKHTNQIRERKLQKISA